MSKYSLEPVTDLAHWDAFISSSKEHSIFSRGIYLTNIGAKFNLYLVQKGNQIKAAVYVISDGQGKVVTNDLVIYSGIVFADNAEQKSTKSLLERFELTEFIINFLDETYQSIDITLPPDIYDIRPFLWHNYHSERTADKFFVDVRYTSYLDISSLRDFDNEEKTALFKGLETIRRRNIREARKSMATTVVDNRSSLFIRYYATLMEAQSSVQSAEKLLNMANLINQLIENHCAKMYVTRNAERVIQYITIFGWDKRRAYYLFGAPNPEAKERYKGTLSFWDAFIDLAKQGIKEIDMEGVNSPDRGWFKLSFGGELKTYFRVSKNREA